MKTKHTVYQNLFKLYTLKRYEFIYPSYKKARLEHTLNFDANASRPEFIVKYMFIVICISYTYCDTFSSEFLPKEIDLSCGSINVCSEHEQKFINLFARQTV